MGYTEDIFTALDVQDDLQTLYTSGTVFHAFLGERLPDWKAAAGLVRKIAENYKLPYYTMSPTYSVCADHGYISGEHYTCPECGKETEVYSRITGYYRPVKNWNDGKSQEFKDRKTYVPEMSVLTHEGYLIGNVEQEAAVVETAAEAERVILFATHTCPNCRMAKQFLDKAGIQYEVVIADENQDLCDLYEVRQAPTLVVVSGDSAEKIVNVSNIRKYISEVAAKRV